MVIPVCAMSVLLAGIGLLALGTLGGLGFVAIGATSLVVHLVYRRRRAAR